MYDDDDGLAIDKQYVRTRKKELQFGLVDKGVWGIVAANFGAVFLTYQSVKDGASLFLIL